MLYEAKVYLNAKELFAWTAVIILISAAFEKAFMSLLTIAYEKLESLGRWKGSPMDTMPALAIERPSVSTRNDIVIRNLNKAYGAKRVLRDFSAVFPAGLCTCIMGSSGVGKTSLFRILMGLSQADSGSISGIEGLKPAAVFQEDRLCDSFNAVANISFACGKQVAPAVIVAHLTALGLGESLNQPVGELSGGMRRRVEIIRAVLACEQILFMDEPLKGLDDYNRDIVVRYIREHTEGVTTCMVTHSHEEVDLMGGLWLTLDHPIIRLKRLGEITHPTG
jgi:NitT/TauT family transport system ATP-binding protein